MQGYTPHPLCFSQNTNLTPMFSSHQEFINQLDFINNLKKQMQQTRVYLDIIIAFSVYLLVISFNSIIESSMKIEVQFVLKIHVLPLSSIILISLKQWLSGQTNCYLRFTQDTKIKIAVIQKIQHGNNPLNQKFKKNVKILHVIQSTYQLKYLHFCLRCHILSLRG